MLKPRRHFKFNPVARCLENFDICMNITPSTDMNRDVNPICRDSDSVEYSSILSLSGDSETKAAGQ